MEEDMTAAKIQRYKETFSLFDKNGDNKISTDELFTVMMALGQELTQQDMKNIMVELDANKNGYIDFDEFVVLMTNKEKEGYKEEDIMTAFKMFDRDGNGHVDREELKVAMQSMGEALSDEELENLLKMADQNNDGKIQYDEFVKMMFSDDAMS